MQYIPTLIFYDRNGRWEFNEWCHGRTGKPMGYPHQAWSAGMYIFAYHSVAKGHARLLSFDEPGLVPKSNPKIR